MLLASVAALIPVHFSNGKKSNASAKREPKILAKNWSYLCIIVPFLVSASAKREPKILS